MTETLAVQLEALVDSAFANCPESPSIAVAVSCERLGLEWRAGARRGEPLTAAGADVPFRIASITKPFVATAVHLLAAEGRLRLSQPVAELLRPETSAVLAGGAHDPTAIRVAHLLSHTSGLPDHTTTPSYRAAATATPERRWERIEQVALAASESQPLGVPGEVYSYSDTGYVLLGEIIEQATGETLAAAVRRLLDFRRIGLPSTWWELMETCPDGVPPPARVRVGEIDGMAVDPSFDLYGGGGLLSSVADLNRFFMSLLLGEILPGEGLAGALATPAAVRAADMPDWRTHSFILASMKAGKYWALGHTGFWGSAAMRLPATGTSIAVTLNSGDPAAAIAARGLICAIVDAIDEGSSE